MKLESFWTLRRASISLTFNLSIVPESFFSYLLMWTMPSFYFSRVTEWWGISLLFDCSLFRVFKRKVLLNGSSVRRIELIFLNSRLAFISSFLMLVWICCCATRLGFLFFFLIEFESKSGIFLCEYRCLSFLLAGFFKIYTGYSSSSSTLY